MLSRNLYIGRIYIWLFPKQWEIYKSLKVCVSEDFVSPCIAIIPEFSDATPEWLYVYTTNSKKCFTVCCWFLDAVILQKVLATRWGFFLAKISVLLTWGKVFSAERSVWMSKSPVGKQEKCNIAAWSIASVILLYILSLFTSEFTLSGRVSSLSVGLVLNICL